MATYQGTDWDDIITGEKEDNIISGGKGNDTLTGGKGNDTIYGGKGEDTAVYKSGRNEFTIEETSINSGKDVQVFYKLTPETSYASNNDGTDLISTDVEYIKFSDGILKTADMVFTANSTFSSLSKDDQFIVIQPSSPAIVGAGTGNDTYLISGSMIPAGKNVTISDAIGANSLQLALGLSISSSQVSSSALKLTLSNGSTVTVLGADKFSYEIAGNTSAGVNNPDVSFASFVQGSLGTTIPSSGVNSGGGLIINSMNQAQLLASTTAGNDFIVAQYASPAIIGAGVDDDTYLISNDLLPTGTNLTISDALGSNSIQLASGLKIASSQVASSALKLTLDTGATVTILGANKFTYDVGGNTSAGVDQADVSYATLVQGTLGTTLPTSGTVSGGAVTIGSPQTDEDDTPSVTNRIVRTSTNLNIIITGAGNDIIVAVGKTAANQYTQSDIDNPGSSGINLSSVITLAELNGRTLSEVQPGEIIDGGAGTNRLVIYGNVDFTGVTLTNITQFQVNSTLTIDAQQLNALGLSLIFGDGDSVINIVNPSGTPVTVDLSGVRFSDFKTLNLGANVTLIVDQADVADLLYLTGSGILRASDVSGTLNLTGKYTTLAIQDKAGVPHSAHGATVVSGNLLIASEAGETLTGSTGNDRLLGGDGNDILNGGDGNDILRGGKGVDEMRGGTGDDRFVIVGDLSGGGKIDSSADTDVLGFPLTSLNGKTFGEDVGGGMIRGGEGNDTLYVFGAADLRGWDIQGIEFLEIRSDVIIDSSFFANPPAPVPNKSWITINGDGTSVIRLDGGTAAEPLIVDLSTIEGVDLNKVGQISVGPNVILKISSLDDLGGAKILTGSGRIETTSSDALNLNGYTTQKDLTIQNASGASATGQEIVSNVIGERDGFTKTSGNVRHGTKDDDYLIGTAQNDGFYPGAGNDLMSGKDGDDTFHINDNGIKIVLDSKGNDTLDLSPWKKGDKTQIEGATLNLVDGGDIGKDTKIQIGAYGTTGAGSTLGSKFNLMLVVDVSGSMREPTMSAAKKAANDLLTAYDNVGDVAVRIVTFGRNDKEAGSDHNGHDSWMSVPEARNIINGLYAQDSTPYHAAMDVAQQAFVTGREEAWFAQGSNHLFFMSDGSPNNSVYHKESAWESFLIDNKIVSNAIGFAGLQNIYHLEPIAYNGVKMEEMVPVIEANITSLGQTLVNQAKLHLIENIFGTDFADTITGNDLDNVINGGGGNDTLITSDGNNQYYGGAGKDIVKYYKSYLDYSFMADGSGLRVIDNSNKTKVDYIDGTVECIQFSDATKRTVLSENLTLDQDCGTPGFFDNITFDFKDVNYLTSASNEYSWTGQIIVPISGGKTNPGGVSFSISDNTTTKKFNAEFLSPIDTIPAISINGFNLDKSFNYNLKDSQPEIYNALQKSSNFLNHFGYGFDPTTFLSGIASAKFEPIEIKLDNSRIKFELNGSFTPGNFDSTYAASIQGNIIDSDGVRFLETNLVRSSAKPEFSGLLGNFSTKLSLIPDFDVKGGVEAESWLKWDAPGLDEGLYSIFNNESTPNFVETKIAVDFDDFINKEYPVFSIDTNTLKSLITEHLPPTSVNYGEKDRFYGRFDSKDEPVSVDFNLPDYAKFIDDGNVMYDYPSGEKLVDFSTKFDAWSSDKNLIQANIDLDDLVGRFLKPATALDFHVNIANITKKDYDKASEVGKKFYEYLYKIDKSFATIKDDVDKLKDLGPIDKGVKAVDIGSSIYNILTSKFDINSINGPNIVSLQNFHVPTSNGIEKKDLSIEFDLTLFGIDVNIGASPIIDIGFDAKDILYTAILSSPEDPSFSKTLTGKVGKNLELSDLPSNIKKLDLIIEYNLDTRLNSDLLLNIESGFDLRALGIGGKAGGMEIPSLPEMKYSDDITSDATYLLHLPSSGSLEEHFAYDLFSTNIELAGITNQLNAFYKSEQHQLDLI